MAGVAAIDEATDTRAAIPLRVLGWWDGNVWRDVRVFRMPWRTDSEPIPLTARLLNLVVSHLVDIRGCFDEEKWAGKAFSIETKVTPLYWEWLTEATQ